MTENDEIQKAILEEQQRLKKLITESEKSIKSFEDRISVQYDKKHAAIKDLEAKLDAVKKPFDDAIARMEKERDRISSKKHFMQLDLNTTTFRIKAKFAEKLPEFPDAESFKGYLLSKDIYTSMIEKTDKKLPNGITLFRHYESYYVKSAQGEHSSSDSDFVSYFAVRGKDIVGYIFTKKSKHPGDNATVYCWINSRLLRNRSQLSKNDYSTPPTIGFIKWKELISQEDIFTAINLNDEKNKIVLSAQYSIDSDAMED